VCTLYCMYVWCSVVTVVSVIHSSVVQSWNLWSYSRVIRFEFRPHTRYIFIVLRGFPHYLQIMLGFRLKYPQMIVFAFRSVIHSSVVQSWNLWSYSRVIRFEFRPHTRYIFIVLRDFPHYLQIMLGFRLKYPQMIVFAFRIVGILAQPAMQHCLITYKSIIYKFLVEMLFVYPVA